MAHRTVNPFCYKTLCDYIYTYLYTYVRIYYIGYGTRELLLVSCFVIYSMSSCLEKAESLCCIYSHSYYMILDGKESESDIKSQKGTKAPRRAAEGQQAERMRHLSPSNEY